MSVVRPALAHATASPALQDVLPTPPLPPNMKYLRPWPGSAKRHNVGPQRGEIAQNTTDEGEWCTDATWHVAEQRVVRKGGCTALLEVYF